MMRVILAAFMVFSAACSKKTSESERGGGQPATATFPETIQVSGSLSLDPAATNGSASADVVASRTVQLVDDNGEVLSETKTTPGGPFTLNVNTAQMGLTGVGAAAIPRLARLKSIFLTEESAGDAVGLRTPIVISNSELTVGSDGKPTLQTGSHTARKVGAIVGKVTLETNEDPTGIDIYIPGTTHIAKTDNTGVFLLGFLPPGTFTLRADRSGFNAIEWTDVVVAEKSTTRLTPGVLDIAKGPKISEFILTDFSVDTGVANLRIKMSSASKYRLSTVQDFSDAVFRPFDSKKTEIDLAFPVSSGARVVTIYLEAVDSGGLTAKQSITIDREAPYLGKIAVNDADGIINTITVPLLLSAEGAAKMRFAETVEGLTSAVFVAFAETHSFTISGATDGDKIIYAQFSDEAGNSIGGRGELFTTLTLDRAAPVSNRIELLAPASPTGAFNTPLAWQANFPDALSYEVQVFSVSNYSGSPLRAMQTVDTSVKISPPLTAQGTYYWRVRAIDSAGNASDWVTSGQTKSFELKVLREAYQPKSDNKGDAGKDSYLGRAMIAVGDLTGDGVAELAVSTISSDTPTCTQCGIVEIINPATKVTLATLTENRPRNAGYGATMVTCDLDGDNKDELIVAAPQAQVVRNGYTYTNVGAIYAYSLTTYQNIATYAASPGGMSDPAPGYSCWMDWDPVTQQNVNRCGNDFPLTAIDDNAAMGGMSRYFGKALACVRSTSGPQTVAVTEPGYLDNTSLVVGAVHEMALSGASFAAIRSYSPTGSWTGFGASVAHMRNFNWSGGTCTSAATIAVAAPEQSSGGQANGVVYLLQKTGAPANWTKCSEIQPEGGDTWEYGRFAARVWNIGDMVDADGKEELAVSNSSWQGGQVRIFGGTGGAKTHSLRVSGESGNGLGYFIGPAGDFDNDGIVELAITAPRARVNGVWDAGKVLIYKLSVINSDDMGSDGAPLLTLTGTPVSGSYLGASFATSLANQNAVAKPDAMYLSSPGKSAASANCPPPGPCGNGAPPPGNGGGYVGPEGAWLEFAFLKLAPSLPTRLTGVSTDAKFGISLAGLPDIDRDGAPDFAIGQSGARCDGRPTGAISLYSVLDGVISRNICSNSMQDRLGQTLAWAPTAKALIFGNGKKPTMAPTGSDSEIYSANSDALISVGTLSDFNSQSVETNVLNPDWQQMSRVKTITQAMIDYDYFVMTDPKYMTERGRLKVFRTQTMASNAETSLEKSIEGCLPADKFGTSADLMPNFATNMDGAGFSDSPELVIGLPGLPVYDLTPTLLGRGAVYVMDMSMPDGAVCGGDTRIILNISRFDLQDLGFPGREGFGSTVIGLPNFGAYDSTGVNFVADAYIFVGNTNGLISNTTVTPEYYVIAVKKNGTFKVVKHQEGSTGSGLGSTARLLPDINGDGVADFAISHPGGTGQSGATGNVQILSGMGMKTPDSADDLMQVLYNPDGASINFGVAVEYSDITGDGLDDFVIGANEFDTTLYKDAGAIYIYRMEAVK